MAAKGIPSAKARRSLLNQTADGLGQAGQEYLAAGRWGESLECLVQGGETKALEELAQQAFEAGDLFYWRQALAALGRKPEQAQLGRIADKAAETGKDSFAAAAREMAQEIGEQAQS